MEIERKDFVKFKFEYDDEFGQKHKYNSKLSTINVDEVGDFELAVEQFKQFLLAQGHAQKTVDKIQVIKE